MVPGAESATVAASGATAAGRISQSGARWALAGGRLQAALPRAAFASLGLNARRDSAGGGYLLEVDVRAKCFREGRPLYDRVMERLRRGPEDALPQQWAVVVAKGGCPLPGAEQRANTFTRLALAAAATGNAPLVEAGALRYERSGGERLDAQAAAGLFDWLGEASCAAAAVAAGEVGGAASLPDFAGDGSMPSGQCGGADVLRAAGCLSGNTARAWLDAAREAVDGGGLPWAALTAWGFEASPVTMRGTSLGVPPEGDGRGGANGYAIFVLPAGRFLRYDFDEAIEA